MKGNSWKINVVIIMLQVGVACGTLSCGLHRKLYTGILLSSRSCTSSTATNDGCSRCCTQKNECYFSNPTCDSGKYNSYRIGKPNAGVEKLMGSDSKGNCCTPVATCGDAGYTCPAGQKKKSAATKCTGAPSGCGSTCCEADPLKCGGLTFSGITCASGKYKDSSSTAWKETATTEATKNTDCCFAKAMCNSTGYTCPTGFKKNNVPGNTTCTHGPSSCAVKTGSSVRRRYGLGPCCEPDGLKCGGYDAGSSSNNINCPTGKYYCISSGRTGWDGPYGCDAMYNKSTNATTKNTDCCQTFLTCAATTYTCLAGYKKKTGVDSTKCRNSLPSSCSTKLTAYSSTAPPCCELDTSKCGGVAYFSCLVGKAKSVGGQGDTTDAWKNTATGSNKKTNCCETAAMCTAYSTAVGSGGRSKTSSGRQLAQPAVTGSIVAIFAGMGFAK